MLKQLGALKYVLLFMAAALIIITVLTISSPLNATDADFLHWVQGYHSPGLTGLMRGISTFGYMPWSVVTIITAAVLFLLAGMRKEALFTVLTSLGSVVSSLVKYGVNRARPDKKLYHVLEVTHQQSFPSGHANFYVLFFGFIAYVMLTNTILPRWLRFIVLAICLFLVGSIGIARMYMGAHFFTDVLAGYLLGAILLIVLVTIYNNTGGGRQLRA